MATIVTQGSHPTLLLIDDSAADHLELEENIRSDFHVLHARDGKDGLRKIYENHPDLILLDLSMPNMNGEITCQRIREVSNVPIIVVTVNKDPDTIVKMLNLGADDYVIKPYDTEVLIARANASLRRAHSDPPKSANDTSYRDAHLYININARRIFTNRGQVHLSPTQFKLLAELLEASPRVLSYRNLLENIWGFEYIDEIDRLRVFIYQLRQTIEPNPNEPLYILNAPGQGYYFKKHR